MKNSFPSGNVSGLEFLLSSYSVIFVLDFMESVFFFFLKDCNGSYFYIILVKKKKKKGCFSILARCNMVGTSHI